MGTGLGSTFVISWSQTETDGLRAGSLDMLVVGAAWRWTGEPVRVDGPQGLLQLDEAEGAAELRRRAARVVRRLIGAAVMGLPLDEEDDTEADRTPVQGFVVTDGHESFAVSIVEVPDSGTRLLMFLGALPPVDRDLWVVRTIIDRETLAPGARSSGGVICFTPGTRLLTPDGQRPIETLRPGDRLQTKDNGVQKIIWCGSRRMTGARLYAMPHLRPVRIRANAFGMGQPTGDLLVSPQHRMLIKGPAAAALFNVPEVLMAAEDLLNDLTIAVDRDLREVTYVHVLLERHQIVWANGLETESFHPSNASLDMIEPAQRDALQQVLPGVALNPQVYGDYARRNISGPEAAILRHELAA